MNDQLLRTFYLELKAYHDRFEKAVYYLNQFRFEPFKPMNITLLFGQRLDNQINNREFLERHIQQQIARFEIDETIHKKGIIGLDIWDIVDLDSLNIVMYQTVLDLSYDDAFCLNSHIFNFLYDDGLSKEEILDLYGKD